MIPWITEFGDKITQFLQTYTQDGRHAKDLFQEVFIRMHRFHAAHLHRPVQAGWLYTTPGVWPSMPTARPSAVVASGGV